MAKKGKGGSPAAVCYALALPLAQQLGLQLWDVRFVKEGASWYLRVFIDKPQGVTISDCVDMTHLLDPVLDEADPIDQSYCLEVSSPGIEREFSRPEHFAQFIGSPVTVRLFEAREGEKEWLGLLEAYQDDILTLSDGTGNTITFTKKEMASVHLCEDWDAPTADDREE